MWLSASTSTIKVGDTLTIKPENREGKFENHEYESFSLDRIHVQLIDYDPEKEYTAEDFPQFDFASVEKIRYLGDVYFYLTLTQPGYYNVCKAVNKLALDPAILSVSVNFETGSAHILIAAKPEWKVSDSSIADFEGKTTSLDDPGSYYQIRAWDSDTIIGFTKTNTGEITIKGLKPGRVTVSYIHSMG